MSRPLCPCVWCGKYVIGGPTSSGTCDVCDLGPERDILDELTEEHRERRATRRQDARDLRDRQRRTDAGARAIGMWGGE